jgi:hypothetical protein
MPPHTVTNITSSCCCFQPMHTNASLYCYQYYIPFLAATSLHRMFFPYRYQCQISSLLSPAYPQHPSTTISTISPSLLPPAPTKCPLILPLVPNFHSSCHQSILNNTRPYCHQFKILSPAVTSPLSYPQKCSLHQ